METISIDHSRKDYGVGVLLATIMLGASLFLLLGVFFTDLNFRFFGIVSPGLALLAGGVGVLFFGYGFLFVLKRFLFPKGALVINDKGIINRTNVIGSKSVIPFTDMKKAKFEIVNASPNIGIELHDEEKYLNRLPFLKRKASEINKNSFGTSIISLDAPIESRVRIHEIIDIINERIEQANSI